MTFLDFRYEVDIQRQVCALGHHGKREVCDLVHHGKWGLVNDSGHHGKWGACPGASEEPTSCLRLFLEPRPRKSQP